MRINGLDDQIPDTGIKSVKNNVSGNNCFSLLKNLESYIADRGDYLGVQSNLSLTTECRNVFSSYPYGGVY